MNIYIEEVFILNFLLDFMILYGTKRILKRNNKLIRIIISSIIGSFTTFILFINISNFILFILKIIISIILILIAFGRNNLLKNISYFYILSIIIGGSSYLFEINNHLLLIVFSILVIFMVFKELINYRNIFSNKYLVKVLYKGKTYELEGFIDTGNRLIDNISKKSIIITNLNIKSNRLLYVPYKALNTNGIIPCINPDKVIINNKEFNNVLIGLSKDKFNLDENCILPNILKEELC